MGERTVLLVDDDQSFRGRLAKALERRGISTLEADSFVAAKDVCSVHQPSHAIVDLRLGGPDGLQVLRSIKGWVPGINVVMLTGYGSIASAVEATRGGAAAYLMKPAEIEEILRALDELPIVVKDDRLERDERSEDAGKVSHPVPVPTLARAEWEHIQRVLTEFNGNISHAALALGIPRRSLQRKLSKYPPPS